MNTRIWATTTIALATVLAPACHRGEQTTTKAPTAEAMPVQAQCAASTVSSGVRPLDATGAGSSLALAEHKGTTLAFIADADDKAIHVVDVDSGETKSTTLLSGEPSQLMVMADGRLAVAMRDESQLRTFDTANPSAPLPAGCAVATAAEPVGLALTPDGKTVLVTSDWGQTLGAYDSATLARRYALDLPRSPRAIVVSDDGSQAFVSHAAGGQVTTVDLRKRSVGTIAMRSRFTRHVDRMVARSDHPNASERAEHRERIAASLDDEVRDSCQGFALAKTTAPGGRILAPHTLVDAGDGSQRTRGYGEDNQVTEVPAVAVIDAAAAEAFDESMETPNAWAARGQRGELLEECILPRTAAVDDQSQTLLVGCFGIDSVVAYDSASARPASAEVHRWRVASGPSGIAVDQKGRRAFVWSQFDRTLNTLDLSELDAAAKPAEPERVAQLKLAPTAGRELTIGERLGRRLFHSTQDSRIASDGRACASCHPSGRDDGLVWSTPNGPRRTIMLAGRINDTAPYGWGGDAIDLEHHLDDTFKRLGGVGGLRSVERDALVAYLGTLQPPPVQEQAGDTTLARGAQLFASSEVGCATCHGGEVFSDLRAHDIGSKAPVDKKAEFETPSLRFIAARGPYFHDGRYSTIRELLVATDGKMGKVGHLPTKDLDALVAYVESL